MGDQKRVEINRRGYLFVLGLMPQETFLGKLDLEVNSQVALFRVAYNPRRPRDQIRTINLPSGKICGYRACPPPGSFANRRVLPHRPRQTA